MIIMRQTYNKSTLVVGVNVKQLFYTDHNNHTETDYTESAK